MDDLSKHRDDELRDELEGMQLALGASLGRPGDGRKERQQADLLPKIKAIKTELEKRDAPRP